MDNVIRLQPKRTDVDKAFSNYNIVAGQLGLPVARRLSPGRKKKLAARLKEHGLTGWNEALGNLGDSSFLRGTNGRGWRADLDFMLQESSLDKLLEGSYADREAAE